MADWNCNLCKEYQSGSACTFCDDGSEFNKMSKADKIRSMTNKEMSTDLIPLIMEVCEDGVPCEELFLDWIQSEAE